MRIRLFDPAAHPRFDDLPWSTPLEEWDSPRLVDLPAGLHRHVVRFVEYGGQYYSLKELPQRLAEREYRLLRTMNDRGLPVVAVVALVDRRDGPDPVLVTRYLHYALPFRHLFAERQDPDLADALVEALAVLLARLHSAGFLWGDCSLSNALFRRDELHLSGYALDTETGELHERLSDGQRATDVELAIVNVAGGLADLAAAGTLPDEIDPFGLAPRVGTTYTAIWSELHDALTYDPDDPVAVDERLRRLHDLGFGVDEAVITDGDDPDTFEFRPSVIVGGWFRRELADLTGITAREHQAQRLLDDIRAFGERIGDPPHDRRSMERVGHRWLAEVYDPVLAAIPPEVVRKLERPQVFIEVLDHDPSAGRPEDLVETARRYVDDVLGERRHERTSAHWLGR